MKIRAALEPMLKPFCLAVLLVAAFVAWVPNPTAPRPVPPSCEALAAELAFRFHPLAQGRFPLLEERVLRQTVPPPCRMAWSYDPPRAWDLARLDRRPRPRPEPLGWRGRGRPPIPV